MQEQEPSFQIEITPSDLLRASADVIKTIGGQILERLCTTQYTAPEDPEWLFSEGTTEPPHSVTRRY